MWRIAMFGWQRRKQQPQPNWAMNVGGTIVEEFGITPLVGYRSWLVVHGPEGLALRSLHVSYLWQPGEQTAACHPGGNMFGGRHSSKSPHIDCSCGFYAALPDEPFVEWEFQKRGRVSAAGQIAMWGRIIECARGYKAETVDLSPDPVIVETSCQALCDAEPTRIELPAHSQSPIWSVCDDHLSDDESRVTVEAGPFLRNACKELSERYGREFINWSML
jgi:hypothetical protein